MLALVALAIGVAGCAVVRRTSCAPPEVARTSGLVPVVPTADEPQVSDTELLKSLADRFRASEYAGPPPGKCSNVLALSAGGMYGAYGVGVLAGWTATGTRPEFDVVTGVSTGALIATYAFLGSSQDQQMVQVYTSLTRRDVYRKRIVGSVLWSDSVASSEPLQRLIESQVDENVLVCVAKAHAAGRRLYVGTTNLNTRRLVVWDMGAIASSGRPDALELYRKILLASSSVPGFLPPVEFDTTINGRRYKELHADGGATTGIFLRVPSMNASPEGEATNRPLAGSNAYMIVAGKLYADPACTQRRTFQLGQSSLQSLIYSQTRNELFRIYTLCLVSGMKYHLTSIPEEFKVPADAMGFEPEEMQRLYSLGYAAMTGGRAWRDNPPGAEPQEQDRPRTGNEFYAPSAAALPPAAP